MTIRIVMVIVSFVSSMICSFYFAKYSTMYSEILMTDDMISLAKNEATAKDGENKDDIRYIKYLEALYVAKGEVTNITISNGNVLILEPSDDLELKREKYVKSISELERRRMKNGIIAIISSVIFLFFSVSLIKRKYKNSTV